MTAYIKDQPRLPRKHTQRLRKSTQTGQRVDTSKQATAQRGKGGGGVPPPLPKAPGAAGLKYPQARIFETSAALNPATEAGKREIKRENKGDNKAGREARSKGRSNGRTKIAVVSRFEGRGVPRLIAAILFPGS